MEDNLTKLENLLKTMDTKSTMEQFLAAFEVALTLLEGIKTSNAEERQQIQGNVETTLNNAVDKAQNRLLKVSQDEWKKVRSKIDQLKDGETPSNERLVSLIKPLIPLPIPGKTPTIEEIKALIPPSEPGPPGSPDTPDQVTDKVNLGKPLIKKERVEGLEDIERIAKANAFNPTMGPSFSDLRDINSTISRQGRFTINFIIDGGGSAITTGVKGFVEIPYAMTITGWQVFADQVGSIVVDVWKDSYTNFPPTVARTITGSQKPTLSSAQSNQNLSLSTWTTAASGGDILAYNVDSVSTVTRITVSILGVKN